MKHEKMIFNRDSYLRESSSLLARGWLLFLGGIAMLVVDSTTSFPTSLMGAFTLYWVVFAVIGLNCLRKRERMAFGAAEKLIRSDRLAAMGHLVQGVAHEIRNPVTTVGGFAHRIKKNQIEGARLKKYMDIIIDESAGLKIL